jgi:hypothetical protein
MAVFLVAVLHRRLRSRQRGSTFVERHGSPSAGPSQRVLPVFIRALRKTSQPSLASLSASAPGVITTANRSAVALSQSLTTPFADPFAGLKGRRSCSGSGLTANRINQFNASGLYPAFVSGSCSSRPALSYRPLLALPDSPRGCLGDYA